MIEIKENRTFHLVTRNTSYIFSITDSGLAEHIYYGKRLKDPDKCLSAIREKHLISQPFMPKLDDGAENSNLSDMLLEFSSMGKGDYKSPLISVESSKNPSGSLDMKFIGYEIYDGIVRMSSSLPQAEEHKREASTLEVAFEDRNSQLFLINYYTVFEESDAITRRTLVKNSTGETIYLNRLYSSQLDLRDKVKEVVYLSGNYLRERNLRRVLLSEGTFEIASSTMSANHFNNPAFLINTEHGAYFMNLIYSSSHKTRITLTETGITHVLWGINDSQFKWQLKNGESFEAPEAVMIWAESEEKGSMLSRSFVESHIRRGKWKDRVRPLMYSTKGYGYDLDEKSARSIIKNIKSLGFEGIVLEDGWFGSRDENGSSLGDWYANTSKFPSGLKAISDEAHKSSLLFGLWVSIENISARSALFESHPDWALIRNRDKGHRRDELILDITRAEVREWAITVLSNTISHLEVDYLKWDMASYVSDIFSKRDTDSLRAYHHSYILALYEIMKTIGRRFPNLYIESSAKGGRFDLGILAHSASANLTYSSDVIEKAKTKIGTSLFYPLSVMTSEIGPSPDIATGRITALSTRFNEAIYGVLSYAIDLNLLNKSDLDEIAEEVEFYKKNRILFQYGIFRREENGRRIIFSVSNYDGSVIILSYIQKESIPNQNPERLYAPDANPEFNYRIYRKDPLSTDEGKVIPEGYQISGDALKYAGIALADNYSGLGLNEGMRRLIGTDSSLYIIKKDENIK